MIAIKRGTCTKVRKTEAEVPEGWEIIGECDENGNLVVKGVVKKAKVKNEPADQSDSIDA